ncbi:MAG: lysophospholipid acyltransferase family protein [Solirubrobacteraceae bacterium]
MTHYATNKPAPPGYDAERYHARTLGKGVNPVMYWIVRGILQPIFHVYFRLSRYGTEHVPKEGPVILASNHRSFLDPLVIGTLSRRPVYYVAKKEHFLHPVRGWVMSRLGAFPVDRGSGDAQAMETARQILERGDCVVIFPEGTRTRPGPLGQPHRGVGRLALQTGAPVVPIAVFGTEAVRRGWRVRPHHVSARCGAPLRFDADPMPTPALAEAATERIWSCVVLQWDWLGGAMPERPHVALQGVAASANVA